MSLQSMLSGNWFEALATATPATAATHDAINSLSVASVATVAVANPPNQKAQNDPTMQIRFSDRGLSGDDAPMLLEGLRLFCFDAVQADIDAGYSASNLSRVNNMAWEFMQADGMGFHEAIGMASEIVAGTQVAACEAAYVDVTALFRTMRNERSR